MKVDFSRYDLQGFLQKEVSFCGIENCVLVTPQAFDSTFTQNNKIFRSSIWDSKGDLLSAGFPKFKNAGEDPENFPVPKSLDGCQILTKADGSLCIVDFYNDKFNARTRGTANYRSLENSNDFEVCFKKYPKVEEFISANSGLSLLFEITSPNQMIVLDYGAEPDLILIGAIDKKDYSLLTQESLDEISKEIGVSRPEYHEFKSFDELYYFCKSKEDMEGFCIYSDRGQHIVKVKTDWYLRIHRLKSRMASPKRVLEFYVNSGCPSYTEAYNLIETTIDYEVAERCKEDLSAICWAWSEAQKRLGEIEAEMDKLAVKTSDRSEQARYVFENFDKEERGLAFRSLDKGELKTKAVIKLIESNL